MAGVKTLPAARTAVPIRQQQAGIRFVHPIGHRLSQGISTSHQKLLKRKLTKLAVRCASTSKLGELGKSCTSSLAGNDSGSQQEIRCFDYLVIGSGIAGLRFAIGVADKGNVAIVTKAEPQEGSTKYAQGGVSAVLDPNDSVENHISDTIVAGAHLNDVEVVEVVCREGPERVRELMAMGASFDRGEDGQLLLAREGGHSHHRIVHAADVTGQEIERALLTAARRRGGISLFEHHLVIDLLVREDENGERVCYGVKALDVETGKIVSFVGGAILLASGGAGHVYPNTTNPTVATGDGVAIALRANAVISNMEFIQFHPTALADAALPNPPPQPRANSFLITEAVRGAGGILRNSAGERFMRAYDRRGELAPRDVVARSIDEQVKRSGEPCVWLDISHKPREEVLRHFPNIAAECLRCGIDITREPIPVVPAAHYMCGGVQTGLHGETSLKGLFAAGEVACTGLHGANRLASNSLLEALVFAQRAVQPAVLHAEAYSGRNAEEAERLVERERRGVEGIGEGKRRHLREGREEWVGLRRGDPRGAVAAKITAKYRRRLQAAMWRYVGIVRSTERLCIAQQEITNLTREWQQEMAARSGLPENTATLERVEMDNLLAVASLIVRSALRRQESRGLHFMVDYPLSLESERLPTMVIGSGWDDEHECDACKKG